MAYISRCRELRDKLLRCGGSISEDAFVTVIIGGLGPQWRSTCAILRAHGKISEAALCDEIHAEQQDMDLQEERHKKKASVLEFAFHTQRRYNNNNYRHQPKPVPPFCHLFKTSGHPQDRDPTGGFRGDRAFALAADEADWDEQNVDNASEEVGPLPYCSVPIPMDDENPRESINAETYFDFADTGYVTPAKVNTNKAERIGPNFIPDPETGDEAAYTTDTTLPRYTQSGLQILGLVTAVHSTETPKEPATVQQALGGGA
ncbi:unnamed protein product [Closterium sp. NIES-53]